MAVLAGLGEGSAQDVIIAVLAAGLDKETNSVLQNIRKFGSIEAFWQLARKYTGYIEEEDKPLGYFAAHVLLTALSQTMNASVLKGLERFVSETNKAYCYSIVHEWRSREDNEDLYELCRTVENELQLPTRFDKFEPETLITGDVFPCINESILKQLYAEISDHVVKVDLIRKVCENRRTAGWYKRFSNYFDCLFFIGKMQTFYQEHGGGFHIVEPKKIWKLYTSDFYRMDAYYRHFHYAFGNSLKNANDILEDGLKHSTEFVEALYQYGFITDYLAEFIRELRKEQYGDALDKYFRLGKNLNQRDTIAVRKMVGGMIKLLYPDGVFTKEQIEEILKFALEMRRRVKEQLKKLGGMEFYDVNFSYIDNDTFEEHFVSVPEQGGGKLIPEGMCNPGQVYTVSQGKSGMIGVFRLESQMLPGNGKFERTGLNSDGKCKEAANTAFNYLKANGNRISGAISTTTKDYIINYQDLQGIGMTEKLALPTLIALCSIALGKPTLSSLAVLGEISIAGTMLKVDELANALQVCLDSGAKKVLLPITSAADLGLVPADLIGCFNLVFYQSAEDAVYKALGVE